LKTITTITQVIGASLMVYGVSLLNVPSAIVLGGSFLLLFGIALEREK